MSNIPPAPPLPTSRPPSQSTRNAFTRFVTQSFISRPTQSNHQEGVRPAATFDRKSTRSSPWSTSSQHSSLKTSGAEISSLDKNSAGTHAVLAGRNILKTIRVDGTASIDETNIRAALIDQDQTQSTTSLDIYDVKWSHGGYSSWIATAASTGKIVLYDVAAQKIASWRAHEHSRQVQKLAFNPHSAHLLLSGSIDGSVLLWDLRDCKSAARFISRQKYKGNSGGIRDVKWCPTDGTAFACSTDSGNIQKWDYRYYSKPKLRIIAHVEKHCTSIDWHPDGKHIMSAGSDKNVKIWDFSAENKRAKEKWSFRAPHPVLKACWRPEYWSRGERGNGSWQCTQLVTSYERQQSPVVHLWDFTRPHMPKKELCSWTSSPTDMLWQSQRLLWVVDRDGGFHQEDVSHAPKVIDQRPMQTFALSPTGEICVFSQKRPRRRPSNADADGEFGVSGEAASSYPDNSEPSKSLADNFIDDNLLSTSYKRSQNRPISARSTKSAASTPPSFPDSDIRRVTWLSDTLSRKTDESAAQSQVAYRGFVDGTLKAPSFTYLAQKYKSIPRADEPVNEWFANISRVFERNACYAQETGAYRVAQTWRVFSAMISHELKQRANENRRQRVASQTSDVINGTAKSRASGSPRNSSLLHPTVRAIQNIDSLGLESSSNVQTPVAKAQGSIHQMHSQFSMLPNPDQEVLELPPSIVEKAISPTSGLHSAASAIEPEDFAVFQESQWLRTANEITARKAQMQGWRAGPRQPLEFGYQETSPGTLVPPRLERHDSDDSFGMFSASSGSQMLSTSIRSQVSLRGHRPSMSRISEAGDHAVSHDRSSLFIPPSIPSKGDGSQQDTKGNLSWLTSSSSMDFGGRNQVLENDNVNRHVMVGDESKAQQRGLRDAWDYDSRHTAKATSVDFTLSDFRTPLKGLHSMPVSAASMLQELFEYYTSKNPNAQAVYHITTVLKPLLTQSRFRPVPGDHGLPLEYHESIPGINELHEEAVLSTYHDQLQSLQIYNPSVALARQAFIDRQHLFDQAAVSSQVGLICLDCNKPINNPVSKFHCENCGKRQANCSICWQKYPAFKATKEMRKRDTKAGLWASEYQFGATTSSGAVLLSSPANNASSILAVEPVFTVAGIDDDMEPTPQTNHAILWQSCLVCGHGAHAACLQHIQHDPKIGGKCPTDGCLCDCIPGPYRKRLGLEGDEVRRKSSVSWVRGDKSSVSISPAVKGARSILDREGRESVGERTGKGEEKRVRVVEPASRRG